MSARTKPKTIEEVQAAMAMHVEQPPVMEEVKLDQAQEQLVKDTDGRLPAPQRVVKPNTAAGPQVAAPARVASPIVETLRAAAGKAGVLRAQPHRVAPLVAQFCESGVYAREGFLPSAAAATFDVALNGVVWMNQTRPGRSDFIEHSADAPPSIGSWIATRVKDLRATGVAHGLALLVVICASRALEQQLPWDELEALARETDATVAVVQPIDGDGETTWEPRR